MFCKSWSAPKTTDWKLQGFYAKIAWLPNYMSNAEREMPPQIAAEAAKLQLGDPNPNVSRGITIALGKLLSDREVITGREPEIANWARETLGVFRSQPGVNSEYGRIDIIRGLAEIDHPDTQLVVVEALDDSADLVASIARRALLDPRHYIYEPSLVRLLGYTSATRNLAFDIITHNPLGGVLPDSNGVLPGVANALADIIHPQKYSDDLNPERKGAIIASILYQRTNGNLSNLPYGYYNNSLYQQARDLLRYYLVEKVIAVQSQPETFADLIQKAVLTNFQAARTARNIEEMNLTLPLESKPEELTALMRLAKAENPPEVKKYQALVALLKRRVRDSLSSQVAAEIAREEEQQGRLKLAMEEAGKIRQAELEKALARQAQVEEAQRRAELRLIQEAHGYFPYL